MSCQHRILYPEETSLSNEGKINIFSDEDKLREYIASRPVLKELLKKILQSEGKWYQKETGSIRSERRATEMVNIWVNIIDHSSTLSSLKCLMFESKNYDIVS